MNQNICRDFGGLYRAAFAERDPERKLHLLREVQHVLHVWQQQEDPQSVQRKPVASATAAGASSLLRSKPTPSCLL
jgi:hypothetical protein